MARTMRIKRDGDGYYHVMSRANNKSFLFRESSTKKTMMALLNKVAGFSGVELVSFCMMDNHFHAIVHVVKPETELSESEVLERIAILKGARKAADIAEHWDDLRKLGMGEVVEEYLKDWRRRMHDVSEFTKTFKELVNIAYKQRFKHTGSIWSGRFASTLIEGGRYLRTCIRYIELNPVRAGIVRHLSDYAFSSRASLSDSTFVGTDPTEVLQNMAIGEGRLMKRVVQIGAGKIFGSREYVTLMISRFADRMRAGRVVANLVAGDAYASHGHLAA